MKNTKNTRVQKQQKKANKQRRISSTLMCGLVLSGLALPSVAVLADNVVQNQTSQTTQTSEATKIDKVTTAVNNVKANPVSTTPDEDIIKITFNLYDMNDQDKDGNKKLLKTVVIDASKKEIDANDGHWDATKHKDELTVDGYTYVNGLGTLMEIDTNGAPNEFPVHYVKNGEKPNDGGTTNGDDSTNNGGTSTTPDTAKQAIYRAYNPNSGEHFYTTSAYEYNSIISKGWRAEGVQWQAPTKGEAVYRLYNKNTGEHFYTTSSYEYNQVAAKGWNKEGIAFYSSTKKEIPVYRNFNPNATGAGSHLYTKSSYEYNSLGVKGWHKEGVAFYGVK